MPLSLYDAFVPPCLQIMDAVSGLIDKAEAHCADAGCSPPQLIEARLYPDMLPFSYQVKSCAVHSAGALDGVRRGEFAPDNTDLPGDFAGLRGKLSTARAVLEAARPDEMEAMIGADMRFVVPGRFEWPFTAEKFLIGFSLPNFYFHATTAYDILRMKGVKLGKLDYLGAVPARG